MSIPAPSSPGATGRTGFHTGEILVLLLKDETRSPIPIEECWGPNKRSMSKQIKISVKATQGREDRLIQQLRYKQLKVSSTGGNQTPDESALIKRGPVRWGKGVNR